MNNILLILEIVLSYISILIFYKKKGVEGLYYWLIISTIFASFMSVKSIDVIDVEIPLGIGFITSIFITTNILIQKRGLEEIKKIIITLATTTLICLLFIMLSLLITPSEYNNFINVSYNNLFISSIRPYIATIISICIAIWVNSIIYYQLRRIKNKIYISNILSLLIAYFIEMMLFCIIAYVFELTIIEIIRLITMRYIIMVSFGVIGTPIIYIADNIKN